MSLIHPTNAGQWADGTLRSQSNCFTHGYLTRAFDSGLQHTYKRKAAATAAIERRRAAGDPDVEPMVGRRKGK